MKNIISNVQIMPIRPDDGLVAFASFTLDSNFHMGSIGIYTRPYGGYRLTYPTRKVGSNSFSLFHPINSEMANLIENQVLAKLENIFPY